MGLTRYDATETREHVSPACTCCKKNHELHRQELTRKLTVYHLPHFVFEPVIAFVGAGTADSAVETLRFVDVFGSYTPPGTLAH
jgi:hypothetical protein